MIYSPPLLKHSPCRPVDWRWRRAEWLLREGKRLSRAKDDAATLQAVRYLQLAARGRCTEANDARQFPDLHSAFLVRRLGGALELELQARVLARQSRDEITQRTGVPAEVIDNYLTTFFDVEDYLAATDWILKQAIWRGHSSGSVRQAAAVVLKRIAYFDGPIILDEVMPYLIGGKDLWADPPDLSTEAGREDQRTRQLVALELLPPVERTDWKLGLLIANRLSQRGTTQSPCTTADLLSHKLDQITKDLVASGRLSASRRKEQMSLRA